MIIDYCGEGFIDEASHEAELDANAAEVAFGLRFELLEILGIHV